jgi:uncharacterized protein (TIGR03067 family)
MYRHILILGIVPLIAAAAAPDEATRKDLAALQGAWQLVATEAGGQTRDMANAPVAVEFKDQQLILAGSPEMKVRFKLDASFNPRLIDLTVTREQDGKKTEQAYEGIYLLDGDTLKICVTTTPDKKERPMEFASKADSEVELFILKRVK